MKLIINKKMLFNFISSVVILFSVMNFSGGEINKMRATPKIQDFTISIDTSNVPSIVDGGAIELHRYTDFQYSRVKESISGHVTLEKTGLMTNISPITGLFSIMVTFTSENDGTLQLYYGANELPYNNKTQVLNGKMVFFADEPQFFLLQAEGEDITLDNIVINYSCAGENIIQNLPKVYIETEIIGGNHAPINSLDDYTNGTFSINGSSYQSGGIRLRGNSTSSKPKKPYRIKLDTSTSFFGLRKAKNWVLLAEYLDASSLHNYAVYNYAKGLGNMSFVNTVHYVEVYLNGDYQGLYLFSEHQDEKKGRVDIEYDEPIVSETNNEDIGFFIELDGRLPSDSSEILGETYFAVEIDGRTTQFYALKYPKKKDFVDEERYYNFFSYLHDYIVDVIKIFKNGTREDVLDAVDEDSLLDFLMVDTIFNEKDHGWTSFKLHRKQGINKLFFGPIWDYDSQVMSLPFMNGPVPNPFDNLTETTYSYFSPSNILFRDYITTRLGGLVDFKNKYIDAGSVLLESIYVELTGETLPLISKHLILDANLWYKGDLSMVFENIKWSIEYIVQRKVYLDNKFM